MIASPPGSLLPALIGTLDLAVWTWLLAGRGFFWQSGPVLPLPGHARTLKVAIVVPARNEQEHIAQSLNSLLAQEIPGDLRVLLIDDESSDRTRAHAQPVADRDRRLRILSGEPLPPGWSGKLWAVAQGLRQPEALQADFILLTDADIVHGPGHLAALLDKAARDRLDLVSEMVCLRTVSLPERALVPAFVFFFQMLYPFRWVGDPGRTEAAAAGGSMLVARSALDRIGGVDRIRGALIDDVALAREIKRGGHPIWLGHAEDAWSLRRYPRFVDLFRMVERTAYVQLRRSPLLLAGMIVSLWLVFVQPVLFALFFRGPVEWLGIVVWGLMAVAFQPTLARFRRSPLWGFALPAIALFYMAATLGSAMQFHRGRGGRWKGRVYSNTSGPDAPRPGKPREA